MGRLPVATISAFACGVAAGAGAAILVSRQKKNGPCLLAEEKVGSTDSGQPALSESVEFSESVTTGQTVKDPAGPQGDVPEDAPEHCPGVQSETAGKSEACEGCPNQSVCASGEARKEDPFAAEIRNKLQPVKHKLLVLSGKGGVGKSTVASQISWTLQQRGYNVGLLDVDICGPSVAKMTGCDGHEIHQSADGWSPVYVAENLAVMSISFMLPNADDAVIWRGPKKNGLIRQFLTDVLWGELDFLIIDTPPGTSDEHLSVVTYMKQAGIDGALVVTTPQEVALADVRKEINFCKKTGIEVLGVVENMTGSVFLPTTGGAVGMCEKMEVPFIGRLSLQRELIASCEAGQSVSKLYPTSESNREMCDLTDALLSRVKLTAIPSSATIPEAVEGAIGVYSGKTGMETDPTLRTGVSGHEDSIRNGDGNGKTESDAMPLAEGEPRIISSDIST